MPKPNRKNTKSRNTRSTKKKKEKSNKTYRKKDLKSYSARRERKYTEKDFPTLVKRNNIKKSDINSKTKWSGITPRNDNTNNIESSNTISKDTSSDNKIISIKTFKSYPNRKSVRNQNARYTNVSFDTWELNYFPYILDLHEIFSNEIKELNIETDTFDFLEVFSNFIRDCSSGEMSPCLEKMNKDLEKTYLEYIIKRNDI